MLFVLRRLTVARSRSVRAATSKLRQKPDFALVADCEDTDFVARDHKPVQRYIAGMAIGNDQFAQFSFYTTAYERMGGEVVDGGLDRGHGTVCGVRVFVAQELKSTLDVIESTP
jgi:hypothetical protein